MRRLLRSLLCLGLVPMPMFVKRLCMRLFLGYRLHPTARIGLSLIAARRLEMGAGAVIGSFTVIKNIDVVMGEQSFIGRGNWITGHPEGDPVMFTQRERRALLEMGEHSAITHRHVIECTAQITIGRFTTVAGWMSQFMTHSIDLPTGRQDCHPIVIGAYCFVGTRVVVLGGSRLPDRSVLGAASLLNKPLSEEGCLYGGVPARKLKELPPGMAYFSRVTGAVT